MRYAEVIGDPIAQSKSPIIHKYWLEQLGVAGDYRRTLVQAADLSAFLNQRRTDPEWLGCNVTIPHKEAAAALVDRLEPDARRIGAVNCVVPRDGALAGYNTDIDGIAAALGTADIHGGKAVVIGAGGAARAAVAYLAQGGVGELVILARNPNRAKALQTLFPEHPLYILPFYEAEAAFGGATAIINASPLGMRGADPMPQSIAAAVRSRPGGATVFDMVTTPARTELLAAAEAAGGCPIDGIVMLVGQAARAFELFYGTAAPSPDQKLRDLLTTESGDSGPEWDTNLR